MTARARLLVVDDHADIRECLRDLLETEGYAVVTAESVDAALAIAREGPPELVLTDLQMPVVGGDVLVGQLRGDPVFASTRIVVLSAARSSPPDGVDAVIHKPFSVGELLGTLQRLLAR